jgi:uncharacterized membrane protein
MLNDRQLEIAMGNMLRIGVSIAALVVIAGGAAYLAHAGAAMPDYRHFHGALADEGVGAILRGAMHFQSGNVIEFGILLLIATPICRVLFGVFGFALMKDRLYSAISAIVLAVLLYSFIAKR